MEIFPKRIVCTEYYYLNISVYTGEPNNRKGSTNKLVGEDCIMIIYKLPSRFGWNDDSCHSTFATICQLNTASGTCEYVLDKDKTCNLLGSMSHSGCMLYFSACLSILY